MTASFNLWSEPWITLERPDGSQEEVGIEAALRQAHEYRVVYEPSPLVIVGIHRLLVAILQAAYQPQKARDLVGLWRAGRFPAEPIQQFGEQFAARFDLFSAEQPFLQSADLPLMPDKKSNVKSVGYLLQEQPAGTAVTHYNHTYEERQQFCPACAAKGLLLIPPFASSGGAGIKPSINGVPPIYILPGGRSYFDMLAASLVTPAYQPGSGKVEDTPWWQHDPVVAGKQEISRVGYLHSLTFPARRVRLHPRRSQQPCTRCGRLSEWTVATMIYEMGESRPKDAPFWRDPFAAYRVSDKGPMPIRPVEGKAIWREFAAMFLPAEDSDEQFLLRPHLLNQLEEIRGLDEDILPYRSGRYPFRTIGLRTDMKMKIFEWQEAGFEVPGAVLFDPKPGRTIRAAIEFAGDGVGVLKGMYKKYFSGPSADLPAALPIKGPAAVQAQMVQQYWQRLGDAFRQWLTRFQPEADLKALADDWMEIVIRVGSDVFRETAESLNSGTSTALICEQAINHCRASLYSQRNKLKLKEDAT